MGTTYSLCMVNTCMCTCEFLDHLLKSENILYSDRSHKNPDPYVKHHNVQVMIIVPRKYKTVKS